MTILASYIYRDGVRAQPFDIERGQIPGAANEFVWIGVHDPDQWELSSLQKTFGLHQLAVEDALNARQVSNIDVYGQQLFLITKTAHLEGDVIEYGRRRFLSGRIT